MGAGCCAFERPASIFPSVRKITTKKSITTKRQASTISTSPSSSFATSPSTFHSNNNLNKMSTKAESETNSRSQNLSPTLVFLCSENGESIKTQAILNCLSQHFFVRSNNKTNQFIENCYNIIQSKVFIFILNNEILSNSFCMSLLGIAISYDIPIIPIRSVGYALPASLPEQFQETEIIDRSKFHEINKGNDQLNTVTTLQNALQTLCAQAVTYHEELHKKSMKSLIKMIENEKDTLINKKLKSYYKKNNTDSNEKSIQIEPWVPEYHTNSSDMNTRSILELRQTRYESQNNMRPQIQIRKQSPEETIGLQPARDKPRSQTLQSHPKEGAKGKHRMTLRRQSSLPSIPTNYHVCTRRSQHSANSLPLSYVTTASGKTR